MLTLYVLCLRPPRYLRGKPVISAQTSQGVLSAQP